MNKNGWLRTLVLLVVSCIALPAFAGFTNNSPSPTLVLELGSGSGEFRVNSLDPESGEIVTAANTLIDPANADTYSQPFSGSFDAYAVITTNLACGLDFDVVFDSPIIGIVATNAFSMSGIGPLSVDLMQVFSDSSGLPTASGFNPFGLDVGSQFPDSLTVDGNRVFGQINFPVESFAVLTGAGGGAGGGGVTAAPEPMTFVVWILLGSITLCLGIRRYKFVYANAV